MKISVAMCTYNGEKYIRQQMDSIFAQTRLPDEIVVCDDISKDCTVEILREYEDRGIDLRVVVGEMNLGFVRNFQKCISLCSGDVIFLCDQDDVWVENKVESLCALMEEEPKILSVCTNFHLIDSEGKRVSSNAEGDTPFFDKRRHRYDWKKDCLYKVNLTTIFCQNIGPGCTQVIRKELLKDYLSCDLPDPHDYVLNRTAALKDGLFFYDKVLTLYRIHGNQTIGVPSYAVARFRKDYVAMAEEVFNVFRELIYHVFLPTSDKVCQPPVFVDDYLIAYYDAVEMTPQLQKQYEHWKKMTTNRAVLYTRGKKNLGHFLRQGRYNKYFVFGYAPVERLRLRAWDLAVLLRRR